MNRGNWSDLIALLGAKRGLHFGEGLSDAEVQRAEESYGVRFPPDLRAFLQTALPLGSPFPNWRIPDDPIAREAETFVLHGILFDVEENGVWLPEWGQRPEQLDDAKALVAKHVEKAPRLIPIYGHRMMPDRPHLNGNPIFRFIKPT